MEKGNAKSSCPMPIPPAPVRRLERHGNRGNRLEYKEKGNAMFAACADRAQEAASSQQGMLWRMNGAADRPALPHARRRQLRREPLLCLQYSI